MYVHQYAETRLEGVIGRNFMFSFVFGVLQGFCSYKIGKVAKIKV